MIKKSEVEARLRKTYEKEVERLEETIDAALVTQDLPIRISVEGISRVAIVVIKEKYEREGGYTVTRSFGDQREPCNDLVLS
jgi:hypothetical protein